MKFTLDKSKTKILEIIIGGFTAVWTIIFIPCLWIIFSTDEYKHPVSIFPIILGMVIYLLNAFRFFKMVKDNDGTINAMQLKIWLLLFVRGVFVSCLYVFIVGKSILYTIVFSLMYIGSLYCEYVLKKQRR